MKIAISNIAWPNEQEKAAADLLASLNITGVEAAPGKISPTPLTLTKQQAQQYRQLWNRKGIEIVAMQALLFGRADLTLFESESKRAETLAYLKQMITLTAWLGAKRAIYGAPKNRKKGNLTNEQAEAIAIPFFRELGNHAQNLGVSFCIEHNPKEYETDFVNTPGEALKLVEKVSSPGFGLHLDAGALILTGETPEQVEDLARHARHFHASQPQLTPLTGENESKHAAFAQALRNAHYPGWVSIEMRASATNGSELETVKRAVDFAQRVYGH